MSDPLQNRNYLHERHHLSHQQIDSWLGENLSKDFMQEKLKQLNAVKLFLAVTDQLRENNIPFVCLKGPLLSYRIYGDPTVRISHDIDLLLDLENLEAALQLLLKNGYQFTQKIYWPQKKVQQEILINAFHHLGLYHKQLRFHVELHWKLMSTLPIQKDKLNKLVKSNLTTMVFSGRNFSVLNKEFELLYLMIHGSGHGWFRLKWLIDINDYPINGIDQERFIKLTEQMKAARIVGQTHYLIKKYFNRNLPITGCKKTPPYLIRFAQKCILDKNIIDDVTLIGYIGLLKNNFFMFPGLSNKWKVIGGVFVSYLDLTKNDFSSKTAYILYRPYSFIKRRLFHA